MEPGEEEEIMDDAKDRLFDHELVGRKVKACYENGWFIGDIMYFNTQLSEFKVDFLDGTSDYIQLEDIDGIEIILQD